MDERRERLKPYLSNALDAYIRRPPDSDSPDALEDFRRRMEAMEEVNRDRAARTENKNPNYRALDDFTYAGLNHILRVANLDLVGMYKLIGVELSFPNDEFAEVARIFERLDAFRQREALELAAQLAVDFKSVPSMKGTAPTQIALAIYRLKRPPGKTLEYHCKYIDRLFENSSCMTIDSCDFPEVSSYLGVSMHWLFQLNNCVSAYGLCPDTESVLDLYGFMPRRNQELYLNYLLYSEKDVF